MKQRFGQFRNRLVTILEEAEKPLTPNEILALDTGKNKPRHANQLSNVLNGDSRFEKIKVKVFYESSKSTGYRNAWRLK